MEEINLKTQGLRMNRIRGFSMKTGKQGLQLRRRAADSRHEFNARGRRQGEQDNNMDMGR